MRIETPDRDDGPIIETTAWTQPCSKLTQWFTAGDFTRIDHDRHPGWSRIYAKVLRDGDLAVGDRIVVR